MDLCAVIDVANKSNVRHIVWNGVEIKFSSLERAGVVKSGWHGVALNDDSQGEINEDLAPVAQTVEQESAEEDLRLSQMMLDDPEAYEEYVMSNHLGNKGSIDG